LIKSRLKGRKEKGRRGEGEKALMSTERSVDLFVGGSGSSIE